MTDTVRLEDAIRRSGYMKSFIAQQLGVSKSGFSHKVNGHRLFTQDEIATLKKILKLSKTEVDDIFFS